jgi:hypothetical protein
MEAGPRLDVAPPELVPFVGLEAIKTWLYGAGLDRPIFTSTRASQRSSVVARSSP